VQRTPNLENIMNYKLLTVSVLLAALAGLWAPGARAQGDDRVGTAAMEELLVPVTARTVALGATLTGGLANLSGIEAVQSNPAALMVNNGTAALFSRTEYVADIGINYVGVAQRFGANNVALALTSWDYGEIARQTEAAPEVDPNVTWDASILVLGATFGRQFTDRIAAGVTLKALGRRIDDAESNGLAFDAGMTYVVGESGLRFGVSLKNFGTEMQFDGEGLNRPLPGTGPEGPGEIAVEIEDLEAELPSLLNFGVSYTRAFSGDLSVTGLANFRSNAYDLDNYAAGLELGYAELFFVRGGVNVTSDSDADFWDVWSVGAGLNLDLVGTNLMVDYAYRPSSVFDGANIFTVNLNL
jgi:hypothetical protein